MSRVLSIGIVGLPNVGKSTLFNALLKKQVANVANYPFCTIEPNIGVIEVPDERLKKLAEVIAIDPSTSLRMNKPPIIPAVVQFYDIAGLVKGASKGEGLGNKFLSHIREVAAIVHVCRLFEDPNVVHVSDKINPVDDMQTIEAELMLADLETIEKSKIKNQKSNPQLKDQKELLPILEIVEKNLNAGIPIRDMQLSDEEKQFLKPLNLLTSKPVIYVFNVSEQQLENKEQIKKQIKEILDKSVIRNSQSNNEEFYLYLCAKLENEVLAFNEKEQKEFLQQYQLEETGLNRLVKKAYETLGLISFLTAGEKEVRAWTITKGDLAPCAAGVIHTDFEKHFIKADIVPYQDFVAVGGWVKAREQGKVQTVGKDYVMVDGEVVEFKVGI